MKKNEALANMLFCVIFTVINVSFVVTPVEHVALSSTDKLIFHFGMAVALAAWFYWWLRIYRRCRRETH